VIFHICLDCPNCPSWETNYILGHNFWLIFPNVLKLVHMKDILSLQLLLKFGPKKYKSLVACTCPKNLYCQKRHLGLLGVKHLANLFRKKNTKKHHYFGQIFIEKWAWEVWLPYFLQGKKMILVNLNAYVLQSVKFLKFTTCSQVSILQDPMVTCVQKCLFI